AAVGAQPVGAARALVERAAVARGIDRRPLVDETVAVVVDAVALLERDRLARRARALVGALGGAARALVRRGARARALARARGAAARLELGALAGHGRIGEATEAQARVAPAVGVRTEPGRHAVPLHPGGPALRVLVARER